MATESTSNSNNLLEVLKKVKDDYLNNLNESVHDRYTKNDVELAFLDGMLLVTRTIKEEMARRRIFQDDKQK